VLPQLLNNLLDYPIQHTTYLSSCGVISRLSRSMCILLYPSTTKTALKPLVATPRTITLPFLIPVDKLVLFGSQHHLLLFIHPGSLTGQSIYILSQTLALLLSPPVLSVMSTSR
jgi:hypothetical protein